MIKFHSMDSDSKDIQTLSEGKVQWEELKKEFTSMKFNSIIGKEKTWEKHVNTFANLERNL